MSREQELGQALNKFITQTEEAMKGGYIYTAEFRKQIEEARKAITEEKEKEDYLYSTNTPGFHIVQQ